MWGKIFLFKKDILITFTFTVRGVNKYTFMFPGKVFLHFYNKIIDLYNMKNDHDLNDAYVYIYFKSFY